MEHLDDLAHLAEFRLGDQILLVDDERRAEFNLLHEEAFDILVADFLLVQELVSAGEFVHEARRIDDTDDVVELSVLF